jgi:hypothetical protein
MESASLNAGADQDSETPSAWRPARSTSISCFAVRGSASVLKEKMGLLEGSPWNYFVQPVLSTSRTHSSSKKRAGAIR